jgi:hypothetical protein
MKFKKLAYLLFVLAFLVTLVVVKKIQSEKIEKIQAKEVGKLEVLVDDLDASAVKKIIAKKGPEAVDSAVLVKTDSGEWRVENYYGARAKKWQIEQILKNVSDIKGSLRSDTPEVLADYSMTDQTGLDIQFLGVSDSKLLHLVCSPERSPMGGNFVRRGESNQVYLTESNIIGNFNIYGKDSKLEAKNFADLQAVKFDTGKVTRLEALSKGASVVLVNQEDKEKKTSAWVFEPAGKEEVDPGKVSTFLSSLTGIQAIQLLDPSQSGYGFDEKMPWVRIFYNADDKPAQIELYLGKLVGDKKTYPLKVMPDGVIYEINQASFDTVKTDRASFLKTAEVKK